MKKYIYSLLLCAVFALLPASFSYQDGVYLSGLNSVNGQAVNVSGANTGQANSGGNPGDLQAVCNLKMSSWFAGCQTKNIIYVGGLALGGGGAAFDYFLSLTTFSDYYSAPYIATTWATMRDLANITFILGIIAVAFMMITGVAFPGMKSWQDVAKRLIIIALLLNFSLFFAQIIIDAGNITGSFFKNMVLQNADSVTIIDPSELNLPGTEGMPEPKSVSATIALAVDPVNLLSVEAINNITEDGESQSFLFAFNIIYLVVALSIAFQLFKAGFMFLSRTLGLVILMIVSPLAFVAYFLPKGEKLFYGWLSNIFTKSFCICIYLFMLFLLINVLQGTTATFGGATDNWLEGVIFLTINVMITYTLLSKASKYTQKTCEGDLTGNLGSMLMKTTVGAGALIASGGAGFAARATVGRAGYTMANKAGTWAGDEKNPAKRFLGQVGLFTGEKLENAKFGKNAGYRSQLASEGTERKNTYDKIYNQTKGSEEKKLREQFKQEGRVDAKTGELTKDAADEAKSKAKDVADKRGQAYIDRIQGSALDWALSGGVQAAAEAKKRVSEVKDADTSASDKAQLIRSQQMAIERDRNFEDQKVEIAGNSVISKLQNLGKMLTGAGGGLAINDDTMDQFEAIMASPDYENIFKESFKDVVGFNDDGSPKREHTKTTQELADRSWEQYTNRVSTIKSGAVEVASTQDEVIEQAQTNFITTDKQSSTITSVLEKMRTAEQNGGVDKTDLLPEEIAQAESMGLEFGDDESIKYSQESVNKLQQASIEAKEKAAAEKVKLEEAQAVKKDAVERVKVEAEKARNAADQVVKRNNKAVADTERATINSRIENITEERTVRQNLSDDDQTTTVDRGPQIIDANDPTRE